MSDQRYNPEVSGTPEQDPRVTSIADRLQQARTLLISHSGTNDAQAEAFMQGDEAGEEGSGSGRNYPDDDAAYDAEGSGEEGSGSQDVVCLGIGHIDLVLMSSVEIESEKLPSI
ncbi:putative dally [Operophtera brumata]|uniref:Putative dally n=1 Tax=Operophtera brumata TaxID=104452 RepID=A0A0L7KXW0_OPEBR|nr:putative dally [Operophtera brumata]